MDNASLFPIAYYWAHFQGNEAHVSLTGLVYLGICIGLLIGFFGVGGQLLMTPLLNILFNVPYNVVVGTDLCQMFGNSSMNMTKYGLLRNVDYKLTLFLLIGAAFGVEAGTRLLELLKKSQSAIILGRPFDLMFLVISLFYSGLLIWIGTTVYRESKLAHRAEGANSIAAVQMEVKAKLQTISFRPMLSLPVSGISSISFWIVLGVGFSVGVLVSFLGVGGSFIGLPALVYVIGCPMGVAISTDLFQTLFVMGYGTYSHSVKGNIDLAMAIVLLTCSTVGMQISLPLARRYGAAPRVRQVFTVLAYLVVLLLITKLGSSMRLVNFFRS